MMVTNIGFNDGADNAWLIRILIIAREKEVVVAVAERQIILVVFFPREYRVFKIPDSL